MPIFTGISVFKFMSYFTATNVVFMLFFYVKCFSCTLFIFRLINYLSWYFLLVVMLPFVTPHAVDILVTLPYIAGRSLYYWPLVVLACVIYARV
jgi:hypothetical protein